MKKRKWNQHGRIREDKNEINTQRSEIRKRDERLRREKKNDGNRLRYYKNIYIYEERDHDMRNRFEKSEGESETR